MMSAMAHRSTRRSPPTRRRAVLALTLALGLSAAAPHSARADDDEPDHYDARVQGYDTKPDPESKSSGVGMVWVLMVLLGGGCVGVMFMNPKRSHLD